MIYCMRRNTLIGLLVLILAKVTFIHKNFILSKAADFKKLHLPSAASNEPPHYSAADNVLWLCWYRVQGVLR